MLLRDSPLLVVADAQRDLVPKFRLVGALCNMGE